MKILVLDTYYQAFLAATYASRAGLAGKTYAYQLSVLLDQCFGTSDFYSRHLNALGHPTKDLIFNCAPLQSAWSRGNGLSLASAFLAIPPRAYRVPVLGRLLAQLPGFVDVVLAQVKQERPEILYCQDLNVLPPEAMARLRPHVGLVVGQIASPLPPEPFLKPYDLILTSFPHFVPHLRGLGINSEYFRIGFESRVLEKLGHVEKDVGASFVGGISRNHGQALPTLEYLAQETPIEFFGYGAGQLSQTSPIKPRHHGEVWGLDMYRALARSRVTLNRHINTAQNNANNMRLYEATGVGTLLITDMKDNLHELFDIGNEVVAYSSPEEAADLIRYYLEHEDEAQAIAQAGQARTLREHSYEARMVELADILGRYLGQM